MKIEIKSRWAAEVLFSFECENNTIALTVKAGLKEKGHLHGANLRCANLHGANLRCADLYGADLHGADLYGADLYGADLYGADLYGANLRGANLRGANLVGANLVGANLVGANLVGANLVGANLVGANLYGANLYGANLGDANLGEGKILSGARPFFQLGPIGSRQDYLQAYQTEAGAFVRAGCFFDTLDQFAEAVDREHGSNTNGEEYRAAIVLVRKHMELWPAEAKEVAA